MLWIVNICTVRRLRTFLHCKCVLAIQKRPSKLSKDFMHICSHAALLHFVLVNSMFFLLPEIQVPDETRVDSSPCALKRGCSWLCPPMDLIVCTPYPTPAAVLWPLTVTGAVEHLSQRSAHQCPKSETQSKSSVF